MRTPALVLLSRPLNLLGIALCAATSIRLASGPRAFDGRDAAIVAGWVLLAAGGYLIDDVRDREFDARFHPGRPIPSGLITPELASRVATGLLAVGVVALGFGSAGLLVVGIATALILYSYGEGLKRTSGLAANVTVSALLSIGAMSGGFRSGQWPAVAVLGMMTFWINLGREIMRDIADLKADRHLRYRTLPLTHGLYAARWLAGVCLAVGGGSGYLLPATGTVSLPGFTVGLTIVNLGLILLVLVPLSSGGSDFRRLVGTVKAAMFAYLALTALHLR